MLTVLTVIVFIDKLTVAQRLALASPSITYMTQKTAAMTISTFARTPSSVRRWEDFTLNASAMVVEDTAPRFDRPTYTDFRASEEEDVRKALDMNVFRVLLTAVRDQQPPKLFQCAFAIQGIKGCPAFILLA